MKSMHFNDNVRHLNASRFLDKMTLWSYYTNAPVAISVCKEVPAAVRWCRESGTFTEANTEINTTSLQEIKSISENKTKFNLDTSEDCGDISTHGSGAVEGRNSRFL